MKVCVVVCLALAHLAAGNILQKYRQQPLNVEPFDYIDPANYNQLLQKKIHIYKQVPSAMDYLGLDPETAEASSHELTEQKQIRVDIQKYGPVYGRSGDWNVPAYVADRSEVKQYQDQEKPYNYQYKQYNSQKQQYNDQAKQYYDQKKQYNSQKQQYNDQSKQYNDQYMQYNDENQYQTKSKAFKSQNKPYRSLKETKTQPEQMMYSLPVFSDAVEWRGIQMSLGHNAPIDKTDIEKIFQDSFKTVKELTEEEKEAYHKTYMTAAENEDILLNTTQLLQKNHYAVEEHTVKTDDGYILTLFRIPPKSAESGDVQTKRPVVFLMHGLLGSSDDWLLMGPGRSLAYLLADLDYDVWMGNARGNKYSRRHVSKHPGQPDFWQFSNDEIALHDLPTMIDYTLSVSKQEKMYYVGYSEGTTTLFALASTRPEYNEKIIMMYALSPLVFMSNTRSPVIKMIAPNSPFYERLHATLGHGEFKPQPELTRTIGGDMLEKKSGCMHVASNVEFVMAGMVDNSDAQMVPMIASHLPAGASTRQIKQYGQAVASREFRRYDYGPAINQKVYGSEVPPKYELSEVQVPVTLYYSAADWLAHPTDVEQLVTKLPQVKEAYKLPQANWSHLDFMFSKDAPQTVYQRLITSIQENQSQKQAL